jgi:hypothetical protein
MFILGVPELEVATKLRVVLVTVSSKFCLIVCKYIIHLQRTHNPQRERERERDEEREKERERMFVNVHKSWICPTNYATLDN